MDKLAYWKNVAVDMICSNCGFSYTDYAYYYHPKCPLCPICGEYMTESEIDSDGNPIQTDKNDNPMEKL